MAYESHGNVYYKFGMVRPDPELATEVRQIVTRFEVGPGGSQISLPELKAAKPVRKKHFDGQTYHERIDARLDVGAGPDEFSKAELAEIYTIEAKKAADRANAAAATAPVPQATVEELARQIKELQAQVGKKAGKIA
ncbi:MAG TPA: hypothetical protein VMX15_06520 [Candidatus Heimdallarchaeota archaeon]|nr:hypothetical protein [Candidatus Heimdallarchaeota archaeon]